MQWFPLIKLTIFMSISSLAAEPKATVSWIPEKETNISGQMVRTVISMKLPEGWHTYWENPGESGIPLEIKADLPEGWVLNPIQYPVPKRFLTGGLAGYGYENQVDFPITLSPPQSFHGELPPIKIHLSWLICNDDACLPGKAELTLEEPDATLVHNAFSALPTPLPHSKLIATEAAGEIQLRLILSSESIALTLSDYEIFPVNPNLVAASANPRFQKSLDQPHTWHVSFPKNEFFETIKKPIRFLIYQSSQKAWSISSE